MAMEVPTCPVVQENPVDKVDDMASVFSNELCIMGAFILTYAVFVIYSSRKKKMSAAARSQRVGAAQKKKGDGEDPVKEWRLTRDGPQTPTRRADVNTEAKIAAVKGSEARMQRHLMSNEFTVSLHIYRGLQRDGCEHHLSESFLLQFTQSAVRVGMLDVATDVLRSATSNRLEPLEKSFWLSLVNFLSYRKRNDVVMSIYDEFGSRFPSDKSLIAGFVDAALDAGKPEKALAMLPRYAEAENGAEDSTVFFRVYAATQDISSAESLFRQLGRGVTTPMLNLLLKTCVSAGEYEKSLTLLQEVRDLEGKTSIADISSYNIALRGLAQCGSGSLCLECVKTMLQRNVQPDDATCGIILGVCLKQGSLHTVRDFFNLFLNTSSSIGAVTMTLLIKGVVRANDLVKALEFYEEMKVKGFSMPDITTYFVLIKALIESGELDRAMVIVGDMKVAGHIPDDMIVTRLLDGCRYDNKLELGQKLFDEFVASGQKPSQYILMNMLKLYGKCGAHFEAQALVSTWEERFGEKPSVIHFTCVMVGCLQTKSYDAAWASFEMMYQNGVTPDRKTVTELLPGMVAGGKWDAVMHIADLVLTTKLMDAIPHAMWNQAVSAMYMAGYVQQSAHLGQLMIDAGIPVDYAAGCRKVKGGGWKYRQY